MEERHQPTECVYTGRAAAPVIAYSDVDNDGGGGMLRPEPLDIVIIILIALLLFGANRLPETARAMGKAIREFKDAVTNKEESKPPETKT